LSEAIADSDVFIRNWYYAGSAVDFPHHTEMRYVDRYFPYAKGGALLLDFPQDEQDLKKCEGKSVSIKARGYRYLIVTKHMNLNDALEALEKVDRERK
jgi:peptidoglycan/xylan/chitin deacetylase (PgdA/CDA1 family)